MIHVIDNDNGTAICLFQPRVLALPKPPTLDDVPKITVGRDDAKFTLRDCALVDTYTAVYTIDELKELRDGIDEALRRIEARARTKT